jgi:hypothetical protein
MLSGMLTAEVVADRVTIVPGSRSDETSAEYGRSIEPEVFAVANDDEGTAELMKICGTDVLVAGGTTNTVVTGTPTTVVSPDPVNCPVGVGRKTVVVVIGSSSPTRLPKSRRRISFALYCPKKSRRSVRKCFGSGFETSVTGTSVVLGSRGETWGR